MEESKKKSAISQKVIDLKPKTRNSDPNPQSKFGEFQPNQELIQSTSRIKNQRDVIMDRLTKMEKSRTRVSPTVFEKVYRDYKLQLESITELLAEKKDLLKKEVKELYRIRERVTVEINRHKEILEEAEFRHYLEEFTEDQFREVEQFETKEIEKFESDLSSICQLIRAHEQLFDPQDLDAPSQNDVTKTVHKPSLDKTEPKNDSHNEQSTPAQEENFFKTPESDQNETNEIFDEAPELSEINEEDDEHNDDAMSIADRLSAGMDPTDSEESSQEFSELLADDQEADDHSIEESQSHIKDLIDENENNDAEVAFTPQEEDLSGQKNLALEEDDDDDDNSDNNLNSTDTNITQQQNEEFNEDEKTSRKIPNAPHETADNPNKDDAEDSISEILESIHLEGEEDDEESISESVKESAQTDASTEFKLTVLDGELDSNEYVLSENTSIGRSPSNDITLKAPKVSRQHAAINKYNNQYIIIDLKSSNGVFVNGAKIDEYVLAEGDEVSVGGYKFRFEKK